MKIRSKGLNKGERFCCSKNNVKDVFTDSEITISFGFFHRDWKLYQELRIQGTVISELQVSNVDGRIGSSGSHGKAFLSFHALREDEFSEKLQREFVLKILPRMYNEYTKHVDENPGHISGTYCFCVELYNGELIIHELVK